MKTLILTISLLMTFPMVSADYTIDWYSINGGGGLSRGGPYQITGTIGQSDAGYLDGGPYEMLGGYWTGGPLCIVNLEHFALFASHWLESPCGTDDNWCGGADLDKQGDVNVIDLEILASHWLDTCPSDWLLK